MSEGQFQKVLREELVMMRQACQDLTMIMGADVSHPAPEHKGTKPSIVAVVGSLDPSATVYDRKIRIQESGQNEEIIHDMRAITKQLLLKFYRTTNQKPKRIIMYRWGG